MIPEKGSVRKLSSGPNGVSNVIFTVRSSTTSVEVKEPMAEREGLLVSGSMKRSKVNLTASALSGVPSWKVTPSAVVSLHW